MQDPNNYLSGSGDDQYNRYPEDLQIAHDLGLTAYRFSIEWSRVEPAPGVFDEKEIVHYQEEVKTVRAQGMEPFVTLWHWSVPNWFVEKGEWRDRANVAYFQEYAAKMAAALPEVKYWLTLNEPNVYSGQAYLAGVWPPGMHNPFTYLKAIRNLVLAHRAAYAALHQQPGVQVGIAQHFISYTADQGFFYDKAYAHFLDWWFNRSIPNSIADTQDFVGVNYYAQHSIRNFRFIATDAPRSDMGWELHPEGLYTVLKEAQQYGKPIYITESGLADAKDRYRSQYIVDSVKQIQRALADGVDVRGYFHWSLIDNFEWSEGFWPRFGLVAVDYATKQRTVRPSALEYAKIIKEAEGK